MKKRIGWLRSIWLHLTNGIVEVKCTNGPIARLPKNDFGFWLASAFGAKPYMEEDETVSWFDPYDPRFKNRPGYVGPRPQGPLDCRRIARPLCHPKSAMVMDRSAFRFNRGDETAEPNPLRPAVLTCAGCEQDLAAFVGSLPVRIGDEILTPRGIGIVSELTAYKKKGGGWESPTAVVEVSHFDGDTFKRLDYVVMELR